MFAIITPAVGFITPISAIIIGIIAGTFCYIAVSGILFKVSDVILGLRVSPEAEVTGLDLIEHSETAYN